MATFCHALSGRRVDIMGSAWFFRCLQQVGHVVTMSSICLLIRGHQTGSIATFANPLVTSVDSYPICANEDVKER